MSSYYPPDYKDHSFCKIPEAHRLETVIKGVALGDSAGRKFEAMSPAQVDSIGASLTVKDLYEKGTNLGMCVTDDTVLACAVAKTLSSGNKNNGKILGLCNSKDFAVSYKAAVNEYPLAGYSGGFESWASNYQPDKKISKNEVIDSCGNGSAMRVAPCGCFDNIEDVVNMAYNSAYITHNHLEGIKGAIVTAVCIWMAFHEYTKDDIAEYVNTYYSGSPYSPTSACESIYDDIKKHVLIPGNRGMNENPAVCQMTVPLAVTCFASSKNFDDCIYKAVMMGWDTDTQAAIAGAIAAAFYAREVAPFSKDAENAWNFIRSRSELFTFLSVG